MFRLVHKFPHPEEALSAVSKDGNLPRGASFETGLKALLRMKRNCEGGHYA